VDYRATGTATARPPHRHRAPGDRHRARRPPPVFRGQAEGGGAFCLCCFWWSSLPAC